MDIQTKLKRLSATLINTEHDRELYLEFFVISRVIKGVGSQEWMALQESMQVGVYFKMLPKPVFRDEEHTTTDFIASSGSLRDCRARGQDRIPGTKKQ